MSIEDLYAEGKLKRERIKPITYSDIKDLVLYDECSPSCIVWSSSKCNNKIKPFTVAGCLSKIGVWVVFLNKKQHKVHRVIYSIVNKVDLTEQDYVIHLDGNTLNNKIDNLKKITISGDNSLCTKCCNVKPKNAFTRNTALAGGVSIYCNECRTLPVSCASYAIDFKKFVEYDENSATKLKRVDGNCLNLSELSKQSGSLKTGYISINHNKYSISRVVLALHGVVTTEKDTVRFKDNNTRNFSITNLEVTTKLKVIKAEVSNEHRDRVSRNGAYRRERRMLQSAKERAKKKGLEFNIDFYDIVIPEFCPILGIKLQNGTGKPQASSPSLDRIDQSRGYIKGNIQVISYKANTMKNDASVEMLLRFAKWVNDAYN